MAKMLNNTVYSENIYKKKLNEFDVLQDELQLAGRDLCRVLGVKWRTPEEAVSVSVEKIQADMEKLRERELERYDSISFCDNDYLRNMEQRHSRLISEWSPYIEKYRTALNRTRKFEIGIKVDSNGVVWLDEKQVRTAARKAATFTWTPEDKKVYTLLGELAEVLTKLREVEAFNYSVLLPFVLADRKKPENDYQMVGAIKGFSITPEKLLNVRTNQNFLAVGSNYMGVHAVTPNDVIF